MECLIDILKYFGGMVLLTVLGLLIGYLLKLDEFYKNSK
jgi:hypothetical protein